MTSDNQPMTNPHERYENPLIARYASPAMAQLWGDQRKFSTWRRLWVALAESEQELGLDIRDAQIEEMRRAVDQIDFEAAARYERELQARRDGACPRVRRSVPQRPSDHPSRGHQLLRDRQHRPAADAGRPGPDPRPIGAGDRRPGGICRRPAGAGLPGIHPPAARPTHDRRQAGLPVGLRPGARPGRSRTPSADPQGPQCQRHDRHPGQFPQAVRWRPHEGPRPGAAGRREDGLCGHLRGHRADLFPESGRADRRCALGNRPERSQSGHRSAVAGEPEGSGRTVRVETGRIVGDGV